MNGSLTDRITLLAELAVSGTRLAIGALLVLATLDASSAVTRSSQSTSTLSRAAETPECTKDLRKLTLRSTSRGEIYDGPTALGFDALRASDGVAITHLFAGFGTPDKAKGYLARILGRARTIFQHGEKKNDKGKVIGERAVISLPSSEDPNKERYSVIWTDGANYEQFSSASLCHALEMERSFYEPTVPKAVP